MRKPKHVTKNHNGLLLATSPKSPLSQVIGYNHFFVREVGEIMTPKFLTEGLVILSETGCKPASKFLRKGYQVSYSSHIFFKTDFILGTFKQETESTR